MRILVVEDERPLARVLERGLVEEGHAVDVAHDLATARYFLAETSFALSCSTSVSPTVTAARSVESYARIAMPSRS